MNAKKVEQQQLVLDRPIDEWLDLATMRDGLHMAELTRPILVESCPGSFHGDPADQMIVATVRYQGAALVTKDRAIRDYEHVTNASVHPALTNSPCSSGRVSWTRRTSVRFARSMKSCVFIAVAIYTVLRWRCQTVTVSNG